MDATGLKLLDVLEQNFKGYADDKTAPNRSNVTLVMDRLREHLILRDARELDSSLVKPAPWEAKGVCNLCGQHWSNNVKEEAALPCGWKFGEYTFCGHCLHKLGLKIVATI